MTPVDGLDAQEAWWKRGEKTSELGRATADSAGVASLLAKVPRKAKKGAYEVSATSSDAAAASAPFQVKKKGGRDNKGGKHYKRNGKGNGKGKGKRNG